MSINCFILNKNIMLTLLGAGLNIMIILACIAKMNDQLSTGIPKLIQLDEMAFTAIKYTIITAVFFFLVIAFFVPHSLFVY